MKPFEDDATVRNIGDLSLENGRDRLVIHGSLEIERSVAGLELARSLRAELDNIVAALEVESLPESRAEVIEAPIQVTNPLLRK